ncbi:MAG: hypothetical protein IAX22_06580 [Candidatus Bathyarchaeota archaeon]|nr:hypothetical protein [Candidatus Bathyarchaeota archaeon]
MSEWKEISDLPTRIFLVLREKFFDTMGNPIAFDLRDKSSTQDDPLDEFISEILEKELGASFGVVKASPLVSPDIVIFRKETLNLEKHLSFEDLEKIFALEIKKLNRTNSGVAARKSGLDYNSTPPCGKVRVYTKQGEKVDVKAFYAFVCQEEAKGAYKLTALTMCDGDSLNKDYDLYLSAVETRQKEIDLGTYCDGLNRNRPMFVFANPLGLEEMNHKATLIHADNSLDKKYVYLRKVFRLIRKSKGNEENIFWCYRLKSDIALGHKVKDIYDFPTPKKRCNKTHSRGKLILPF